MGDLNEPDSLLDACAGIDVIIHAAALVSFRPADREQLLRVNGEGTANLVNVALEAGVRRLIHVSSVAVLNRRDGGPVVTLADRWPDARPNTSYAESKFAAEREVWRGQAEGLSVAALYPSHLLGVGDWAAEPGPALWRIAATGLRFFPGGTAGFLDVDDAVDAVRFVLERDQDGDRFLLNAVNWSWREILERIAVSVGAKPPQFRLGRGPASLLWPAAELWGWAKGRPALFTRESHRNIQANFRYDGSAYSAASGRTYRNVEETIRRVGAAYRADHP